MDAVEPYPGSATSGTTQLVSTTKSVGFDNGPSVAYWSLTLYPTAGEAGGSVQYSGRRLRRPGEPSEFEPDREHSANEAVRRARGKMRRYGTANGLNRLGTLTYRGEGCHDPVEFRRDIGVFFRDLREGLGGERFPYMWVPEWHPGGHGLHAHFVVGRFVRRSLIEQAWGRGFVHIKLLTDLPVGSGRFEESRRAARYVAKYVGKELDAERLAGLHRYDVGRGFAPQQVRLEELRWEWALERASEVMGGSPGYVWHSDSEEDWAGPPAVWASW